jgi:hypothetical protein
MARSTARLIAGAFLLAIACSAGARDLQTPQTPWRALTPEQQRILGPVGPQWDRMPGYQQQRLLGAARRYPSMQQIQKDRFERRIRDWSQMTPEQRRAARETFQGLRRLPPERQHELRERWLRAHPERSRR